MKIPFFEYLQTSEAFYEILFLFIFHASLFLGIFILLCFVYFTLAIAFIFLYIALFVVGLYFENIFISKFILIPLEILYAMKEPFLFKLKKDNPYSLREIYFKTHLYIRDTSLLKYLNHFPHLCEIDVDEENAHISIDLGFNENFNHYKINLKRDYKSIYIRHCHPHLTLNFHSLPEKFKMDSITGIRFNYKNKVIKIKANHDLAKYLPSSRDTNYIIAEDSVFLDL